MIEAFIGGLLGTLMAIGIVFFIIKILLDKSIEHMEDDEYDIPYH